MFAFISEIIPIVCDRRTDKENSCGIVQLAWMIYLTYLESDKIIWTTINHGSLTSWTLITCWHIELNHIGILASNLWDWHRHDEFLDAFKVNCMTFIGN